MLKKERRLNRNEFKYLSGPFKIIKGNFFLLRVFKLSLNKSCKFAVSVSKKKEKKAYLRNKIRRMAYDAINSALPEIKDGFAYHFVLNNRPINLKRDITIDISKLLPKISNPE